MAEHIVDSIAQGLLAETCDDTLDTFSGVKLEATSRVQWVEELPEGSKVPGYDAFIPGVERTDMAPHESPVIIGSADSKQEAADKLFAAIMEAYRAHTLDLKPSVISAAPKVLAL